jgi:pimeloyl-ACP methyl ester carboxylesterase
MAISESIRRTTIGSGLEMAYCEAGTGATLVQVHGLGTGHRNFDLLRPHLARRLRVLDLDLPGYGDSDRPPAPRTMHEYAADVAQFVESLELAPVHVHGGSMGGLVAMLLAARRPELVDRLVITCSFGRLDHASRLQRQTWRTAARAGAEALAELTSLNGFSRSFWDRPESEGTQAAFVAALSTTTPQEFLRDLDAMDGVDVSDDVRAIRAPTLLLGADEDRIAPVHAAPSGVGMAALAELIPNARLEVLESCGHFVTIEQPEETARRIADFVLATK